MLVETAAVLVGASGGNAGPPTIEIAPSDEAFVRVRVMLFPLTRVWIVGNGPDSDCTQGFPLMTLHQTTPAGKGRGNVIVTFTEPFGGNP